MNDFLRLSLVVLLAGSVAQAGTGFATRSKITFKLTRISLGVSGGSAVDVYTVPSGGVSPSNCPDGSTDALCHDFNRGDADMSAATLSSISVPYPRRYSGVSVCYKTSRFVQLDGVKYQGTTQAGGLTDGDTVYTTGSDATATNTVTKTAPAGGAHAPSLANYVSGNGSENCSMTTFTAPICVAHMSNATEAATCVTTTDSTHPVADQIIDLDSATPDVNIMLDMYHCVGVDGASTTMQLDPHVACYPYATIGKPGAAIHLSYNASGTYANVVLLFGNDGKLAYASSDANGGPINGFCSGVGAVSLSGASADSGVTWAMDFSTSAPTKGRVRFATGNCGTTTTCTSSGVLTMDNVLQAAGSTVNVTCPADNASNPFGLSYTGGPGQTGTAAFTISRVVDPQNLFKTKGFVTTALCSLTDPHYVAGSAPAGATEGGTCATVTTGGGYP